MTFDASQDLVRLLPPLTYGAGKVTCGGGAGSGCKPYDLIMPMPGNILYYGDNLDVLRQHIPDESVDLVYLDPPFNSNASYNVLFAEQDGTRAAAQVTAFEDTWRWDQAAVYDYEQTVEQGGRVADALMAMRTLLGGSNMLAYLSMMAPRLLELRRVLKSTGSIYLHCDPTASHYLKLLMDAVFGPANFRNDITWRRTFTVKGNAGQGASHFGRNTDSISEVWTCRLMQRPQNGAAGLRR